MTAGAYYDDGQVVLHHGDALDVLRSLPDCSVDAVVTDPPYGLEFMGADWDAPWRVANVDGRDQRFAQPSAVRSGGSGGKPYAKKPRWSARNGSEASQQRVGAESRAYQQWCQPWAAECLRVLKPGGHLLAFGGTRTVHRLVCAVEDAGAEIRDSMVWIYGQGFPKSRNLDGEWAGWGTALKPAHEQIVVARKPLAAGTVAGNVLEWGTGALNIAACRVDHADLVQSQRAHRTGNFTTPLDHEGPRPREYTTAGRWPTNVTLDEHAAAELDRDSGDLHTQRPTNLSTMRSSHFGGGRATERQNHYDDTTSGASRFFPVFKYEPKAPTSERPRVDGEAHATVKPLDLMRWLVRLVCPPGGTVLDPFAGSGTTAEACVVEGFRCITVEREAAYLPLIVARLSKPIQPVLGDMAS